MIIGRHSFLIGLCLILLTVAPISEARKKDETRASGAIDAKTFEVLTAAQEQTKLGKYAEAIALLDSIRESREKLNSYARSQMWNFYAYIYASQEQYRKAVDAYLNILAEVDAPEGLKLNSKYTLAQLYFQLEDYDAVIDFMGRWLGEVEQATATAYIMLTQAHFHKGSFDASLSNLDKAIAIEREQGNRIKESWLRLKIAIFFEQKNIRNVLNGYKELMTYYPRISYLRQIAGLYSEMEQERRRLTAFDAVYLSGNMVKQEDLLNLAYMYLGQEIPYKAAKIMEKAINEGKIQPTLEHISNMANAWAQANEHKKAIPALQKAAKLSDKGILYARLAGVHFDAGDFKKAAEAARQAAKKKGLKRADNNQMLLGMALFNSKRYEEAIQAFRQAKKSPQRFAAARKWEQYTLNEIERLRALEAGRLQLAEETRKTMEDDKSDEDIIAAVGGRLLRDAHNGRQESQSQQSQNDCGTEPENAFECTTP